MIAKKEDRFSGRKSRSFGLFLLISSAVILFVAIGLPLILNKTINTTQWLIIGLIVFPIIGLFLWWWIATYYIIDHDNLIVKWGPFKWIIPINDISIIRLNQKTIGGTWKLTLSWDCMEIKYKKYRSVFITPDRQDNFISRLKEINDKIDIKKK